MRTTPVCKLQGRLYSWILLVCLIFTVEMYLQQSIMQIRVTAHYVKDHHTFYTIRCTSCTHLISQSTPRCHACVHFWRKLNSMLYRKLNKSTCRTTHGCHVNYRYLKTPKNKNVQRAIEHGGAQAHDDLHRDLSKTTEENKASIFGQYPSRENHCHALEIKDTKS